MKRRLLALGLISIAIVGAFPARHTFASDRLMAHQDDQAPQWAMVKPYDPVVTQTVPPHNSVRGVDIAHFALRFVGFPYTLVGNLPQLGFSCIGFVSYVYISMGIPLPDDLENARAYAPAVGFGDLRPGDILWFGNTVWPGLSHTAIYLGGGRFVHAAWFGVGVIVSSFRNDPRYGNYWTAHYLGASRPWGNAGGAAWDAEIFPQTVRSIPRAPAMLVATPVLRLRRWWSLSAPVHQVVPRGTPLYAMQRRGQWYQVMTPDGGTGWVLSIGGSPTPVDSTVTVGHAGTRTHRLTRRVRWVWSRHASNHHVRARHTSRMQKKLVTRHRTPLARRNIARSSQRHAAAYQRVLTMLRVHVHPGTHTRVEALAVPGLRVRVLSRAHGWAQVQLPGGRTGYVADRYLR